MTILKNEEGKSKVPCPRRRPRLNYILWQGHGFVQFSGPEAVELALKKDGKIFQNRPLVVRDHAV